MEIIHIQDGLSCSSSVTKERDHLVVFSLSLLSIFFYYQVDSTVFYCCTAFQQIAVFAISLFVTATNEWYLWCRLNDKVIEWKWTYLMDVHQNHFHTCFLTVMYCFDQYLLKDSDKWDHLRDGIKTAKRILEPSLFYALSICIPYCNHSRTCFP